MSGIIDFHSHVLPGLDDGSVSVEESISMLLMEAEQGVKHVIATPHFYAQYDNLERFLEKRTRSEQLLRKEMKNHIGLPELNIGAEVHFFTGISDSEAIENLAIDSTKYILIEMPHPPWSKEMYRDLEGIFAKRGLTPIVAHVDRYISRFRTFKIPERLEELPVLVQANAEFFLQRSTAQMALRMLERNQIHLLGSDCHNLQDRKPNLQPAIQVIQRKLGKRMICAIENNGKQCFSQSSFLR